MFRPWFLLALAAACAATPAQGCDTGPFRIYYHSGSARLSLRDRDVLDYMKESAGESGFIRLLGHTDTAGRGKANLRLSRRRVEEARNFLIGLGMPADRILTESFGESRAITALDDASPSWKHRYLQVEIVSAAEARKGRMGRASTTCGGG